MTNLDLARQYLKEVEWTDTSQVAIRTFAKWLDDRAAAEPSPPRQAGHDPGIPVYATLRGAERDDGMGETHLECRFRDGQKWAAATVDAECDELAALILRAIEQHNAGAVEPENQA